MKTFREQCGHSVTIEDVFGRHLNFKFIKHAKTFVDSIADLGKKQLNLGLNIMPADIQRHSLTFEDVHRQLRMSTDIH